MMMVKRNLLYANYMIFAKAGMDVMEHRIGA